METKVNSSNESLLLFCSRHRNNQISEFQIPNILFTCLINSRARHSAIYMLKSRKLFWFFLNLKEASKCVLRIIRKNKNFVVNIGDSEFGNLVVRWREQDINQWMLVLGCVKLWIVNLIIVGCCHWFINFVEFLLDFWEELRKKSPKRPLHNNEMVLRICSWSCYLSYVL